MDLFDRIWSRIVKVGGFVLGSYIMWHEAVKEHSDRPYLYAAALAMMGLQIAEVVSRAVDLIAENRRSATERRERGKEPNNELDRRRKRTAK